MIKVRLRFSKGGKLRFIGHLDFLKVFQQTLGRAKLPVAYSHGFNPHMQLSFALPLPLGMTSGNDYADLTLESEMPEDEIISRLNAHAPGGLVVTGAREFTGPGAAALAAVADYVFEADDVAEDTVKTLLARESIVIPKKTKSGVKDTDIRPDILDVTVSPHLCQHKSVEERSDEAIQQDLSLANAFGLLRCARNDGLLYSRNGSFGKQGNQHVIMRLAAGSARFLNPLIVAGLLLGRDACPASITRAELYRRSDDINTGLVTLYDAPIN